MNASHDTIDNTVDRALSALRDAQPRPGLEARILASLEDRTATVRPARFHFSAQLAPWAATSAAILAIASLILIHHQRTPVRPTTNAVILSEAHNAESKGADNAHRAANTESFSTANLGRTAPTVSSRRVQRSNAAMRSGETCISDHNQSECAAHDDNVAMNGVITPTDAQALADLHAPSHPAPPLPLTPQEKLFLRMLRYGNATQLAELNPIVREQHDAAEAADFKTFFPDPPPLQQPNGDTE